MRLWSFGVNAMKIGSLDMILDRFMWTYQHKALDVESWNYAIPTYNYDVFDARHQS